MSLLSQIQNAAIDSSIGLPTLLRKCTLLASRLESEELKVWINCELSGYSNNDELPEYRKLKVNSKGHFSGAFGSGLRNADIPLSSVPEQLRESLGSHHLKESVAALEALAQSSSSNLQVPWNPDLVAYLGENIYQNMNCMQAWKVISTASIIAMVDTVRTRVLNFSLEIEAQNPSAGESALNSNPVPTEKVHQIFNTYITGTVQNLTSGSSNVRQTANYIENDASEIFKKILDAVNCAQLELNITKAIESTILQMQATKGTSSFKQHYQSFIGILADHMQVLGPVVTPFLPALSALIP